MIVLSLSNVIININEKNIIAGVSFDLLCGKALQIIGDNGSGKTTLIKAIMGLVPVYSGTINKQIKDNDILYIGHESYLNDSLTVRENLEYLFLAHGIKLNDSSGLDYKDMIDYELNYWGMLDSKNALVSELSFGQRRKVLLCLLSISLDKGKKKLIILDEPLNGLDDKGKVKLLNILNAAVDGGSGSNSGSNSGSDDGCGVSFVLVNHGGKLLDSSQELYL